MAAHPQRPTRYSSEDEPTAEAPSPGLMLDDATILAMCDDGNNEGQEESIPLSAPPRYIPTQGPPTGFGMEGSTFNISHSRDIHIGAKTVPRPQYQPHPQDFSTGPPSPAPTCDSSVAGDVFSDGYSMMSSSFSSLHLENVNMNGFSPTPCQREREDSVPSTVFTSMYSTSSESEPPEPQRRTSYQAPSSVTSPLNVLRKSVSSPAGDIPPPPTPPVPSSPFQCQPQGQRIMEVAPHVPGPRPQISAAINNSSNVHLGTRFVYNVYFADPKQVINITAKMDLILALSTL